MNCDYCHEPFADKKEHVIQGQPVIPYEWNEIHYVAYFNGRRMDLHGICYRDLEDEKELQLCLENGRHEELSPGESCWACGYTK